jgi:hypothetical protein
MSDACVPKSGMADFLADAGIKNDVSWKHSRKTQYKIFLNLDPGS